MGWWKLKDSNHRVGDGPLDILGDAVGGVIAEYESEYGRKPTQQEWEGLLRMVLGNPLPEYSCTDDGQVVDVVLKLKTR